MDKDLQDMRITVFARPVHHPAFPIQPGNTAGIEELPGYEPSPNPLDEIALEYALALKDSAPSAVSIRICSVGGAAAKAVLRDLMACGADEAVCLEADCWEPDRMLVSRRLSDYYRSEPFDLGLFGDRDLDTDTGQAGAMFSAITGVPYIDSVSEILWTGDRSIEVTRRRKRQCDRIRIMLPACLGILKGGQLRYPSFWDKVRREQIVVRSIPLASPDIAPLVVRNKFTRSKPRKGSSVSGYVDTSGADRIRQAMGMAGKSSAQKDDSLIKDASPDLAARKIIEIWKQEKVVDLGDTPDGELG